MAIMFSFDAGSLLLQKRTVGKRGYIRHVLVAASPEVFPAVELLPHVICSSRNSSAGCGDEECEPGDAR